MNKLIKMYTSSGKGLPQLTNYGSLYGLFKTVLFEGFNDSNVLNITKNGNILTIKTDASVIVKYPINDVLKCSFYEYELLVTGHIDNDTLICECMNYNNDELTLPNDYTGITIKNAPMGFKLKFSNDNEFKMVYTTDQDGGLDYCLYDTYFGDTGGENGGAPCKRAIIFCSTGMQDVDNNDGDIHFPQTLDGSNNYKSVYTGAGSGYKRAGISTIVYGAGVEYIFIGNGNFFYFIVKNKFNITTDKPDMVNKDVIHGFGKIKNIYNDTNTNLFISAPSSVISSNYGDCAVSQQHLNIGGYCSFNSYMQPQRSALKHPTVLNDVSAVFTKGIFSTFSTLGEYSINYESGCSYSAGANIKILSDNINKYSITRSILCVTDQQLSSYTKTAYMPFMFYFTTQHSNTPNFVLMQKDNRIFYTVNCNGYSLNNVRLDSRFLIEITPKGYNNYD